MKHAEDEEFGGGTGAVVSGQVPLAIPPIRTNMLPCPSAAQQAAQRLIYPESDGKPIAEHDLQYFWIAALRYGFEEAFAERDDVYIASDLFWYPIKGRSDISVAPDVLVVFGRHKGIRGSYLQWAEENIAPQVVWEVMSQSNTMREMLKKRNFYKQYGCLEYYLYDPFRLSAFGLATR